MTQKTPLCNCLKMKKLEIHVVESFGGIMYPIVCRFLERNSQKRSVVSKVRSGMTEKRHQVKAGNLTDFLH